MLRISGMNISIRMEQLGREAARHACDQLPLSSPINSLTVRAGIDE